jgi:hypothetical protein
MLGRQVKKQIHHDRLGKAVANALKCLYSDPRLDKFWKEAILNVFVNCFKEQYPVFPEQRFKEFVRGK